jgi:RNA polymerase sporulation-specific sigma factor
MDILFIAVLIGLIPATIVSNGGGSFAGFGTATGGTRRRVGAHVVPIDVESATDEELVELYREGVPAAIEALLTRYRNFARLKGRSYFLAGADQNDIVQEGMIGLYKAIRDFSAGREASFRAFAEICITRQIITAVKTATRQKHLPLNQYVSLTKPAAGDGDPDRVLQDVLQTEQVSDPAELVISHDELRSMKIAFAEILSDFEAEVLHKYIEGQTYHEIAASLSRHAKSIDNALQRIKRKVQLHLRGRSDEGGAGRELVGASKPASRKAPTVQPRISTPAIPASAESV